MLEVKINNNMLNETINFLFGMSLKGKQSRMRTRFIKIVNDRIESVLEEEGELFKEYCHLDEQGEPKKKDENTLDVIEGKEKELAKERVDLYNEEYIIDGANNQTMLKTIRTVLDECEVEFSGRDAVFYEYLCEKFKVDEDIDSEKEED